ncbi:MAG TPA: acyl-CoA dehydrogenase family protein [bacterium]|nr:acyl-CoA dehydrogenase family protein [bacterium]
MDFEPSKEQKELREAVVRFARRELADDVAGRDARGEFSRILWQRCASFGVQGFPIPEDYGGSGLDPLSLAIALEALGYACADNGLLFSLGAQMWSCQMPILTFGREDQKRRFLPGLCDGSLIGVQAMTEPASGSDAFGLTTRAERTTGGYVLNGTKTFITNAPVADVFVVFARTGGEGFWGVSAFLVERNTPGLSVSREIHKMGLRTSPMGEVVCEDCEVPEDTLLGPLGGGLTVFNSSMEWERGYILACAIGTMQRQLERCIRYAKERRQFGQPIGKFQAVSHRLVDMQVRLETSRLLLYKLGWLRAAGQNTSAASATAKLHVSEAFLASSLDAVQVHGGYGYTEEYELERDVRDAVGGRLYSGTSDIQKNIIAGRLGL